MNVDVQLVMDKVWTYVKTEDDKVHGVIDKTLCVLVPGRWFSWKFKAKLWDGMHHFYDFVRGKFLTGFIDEVVQALERKGYKVEVINKDLVIPAAVEITTVGLNGSDFDKQRFDKIQLPLLQEMLREGRACVRLATGGGKTEIMAGLAKVLSDKYVLIFVHRVELLAQTIERLELRLGEKVGRISSDEIDIQRVTVGMVMSVWSKRQQLRRYLKEQVEVTVNDECHRVSSDIWSKCLMITDAKRRYGVSGTPLKNEDVRDKKLIGLTGKVIQGIGVKELVNAGYAVMPEIKIIDAINVLGKVDGAKYSELYNKIYTDIKLWNLALDVVRWHNRAGLLIFTERKEVCLGLGEFLILNGIKATISHGTMPHEDRLTALDDFKKGKIDVLVTTTILDEGVDVPSVSGVMFMTTGKSVVRIMQRIGRGVRKDINKNSVKVYEYAVDSKYCKKHLFQRMDLYAKEGFNRSVWKWDNGKFLEV